VIRRALGDLLHNPLDVRQVHVVIGHVARYRCVLSSHAQPIPPRMEETLLILK
jgi:hypothetical protein